MWCGRRDSHAARYNDTTPGAVVPDWRRAEELRAPGGPSLRHLGVIRPRGARLTRRESDPFITRSQKPPGMKMEWRRGSGKTGFVSKLALLWTPRSPGFCLPTPPTQQTERSNEISAQVIRWLGWVWLGSGPTRSGVTVLIVPSILDLRVIRLNPTLHAPTGWNTYLPVLLVQTRSTNKKPVFDLLLLVLTPTYNFYLRHQELSLKLEHVSYSTIGNVPRVT